MPRIAASTIRLSSILSTYSRRTRSMTSATIAADSTEGSTAAAGAALARPMKVFQTVLESANPNPNTVPVSSTATPRKVRAIRCFRSSPKWTRAPYHRVPCGTQRFPLCNELPSGGRGALRHPGVRIDGLAVRTDLEIQAGMRLPTRVANLRDRLAGLDPVAGFLEQRLVVAIEAHVAAAVVDDDEQAQALQPVGERDAAAVNGPHRRARRRFQQHAVPLDGPGAARLAVVTREASLYGPRELALRPREWLVGIDGEARHDLAQALDE